MRKEKLKSNFMRNRKPFNKLISSILIVALLVGLIPETVYAPGRNLVIGRKGDKQEIFIEAYGDEDASEDMASNKTDADSDINASAGNLFFNSDSFAKKFQAEDRANNKSNKQDEDDVWKFPFDITEDVEPEDTEPEDVEPKDTEPEDVEPDKKGHRV